jgi:endo-1,4-beta-xylanase
MMTIGVPVKKLSRRRLMKYIGAGAGFAAATACAAPYAVPYARANLTGPSRVSDVEDLAPLRSAASLRGRRFGAAVATRYLDNDSSFRNLVLRECDIIVPEWEMKWYSVEKRPGSYDFSACDRLAAFAAENGKELRGTTVIWHMGLPDWAKSELKETGGWDLALNYMNTVMSRYAQVKSWDVVNEAVEPFNGRPDGLRESPWLDAFGPSYIADSFKMAEEIAPNAQLVYNDYGTEHDATWNRNRRTAILRLIEQVRSAGGRIDALGLQAHLRLGDPWNPNSFAAFLREVEDLGILPIITELDVRADRLLGDEATVDGKVADMYTSFLETVFENSRCDTVITWGLTDKYSFHRRRNARDRPLPFDENYQPKKAAGAILQALRDEK